MSSFLEYQVIKEKGEHLTIAEVAQKYGCSVSWIYKLVEREKLPYVRFGRRVLVPKKDLP